VYIHALYEKGNEKRGTREVLLKWTDTVKKKKFEILFSGTTFIQTNYVFITNSKYFENRFISNCKAI